MQPATAPDSMSTQRDRYRVAVEQATQGIVFFEPETKCIVEANPALHRLLGYSAAEVVALTLYDVIAEERASIDANTALIVAERQYAIGVRQYRRKDGTIFLAEVSGVALTNTDPPLLCAIIRDVTEREQAVAALAASEARLRAVLESAPMLVFVVDLGGVITFAAGQTLATLGLAAATLIGQSAFALSESPDVPGYLRRALAGEMVEGEVATRGRVFTVRYVPRRDSAGAVVEIIGTAIDVTGQSQAEAKLRRIECGLSPMEQRVLTLLGDSALHYDEIARQLNITRGTAITYAKRIARKLGTTTKRAVLLDVAAQRGLLATASQK